MNRRNLLRIVHASAGSVALLTILTFQTATLISEMIGDHVLVASVKAAIAAGLLVLIPALVATGGSGMGLTGFRPNGRAAQKLGRMKIIAANGVLILVPTALFLNWKAGLGEFDLAFYAVQALEIVAGLTNLVLLGLNMRDGLRMTGHIGRGKPRPITHPV